MNILLRLIVFAACCFGASASDSLYSVSICTNTQVVGMGQSVTMDAYVVLTDGRPAADALVLPYVNGLRWGAHERTDASGRARFLLPLPMPGRAEICVEALTPDEYLPHGKWLWTKETKDNQALYFQKTFNLSGSESDAELWVAADDACNVFINGEFVVAKGGMNNNKIAPMTPLRLKQGENLICAQGVNGTGFAGILFDLKLGNGKHIASDSTWTVFEQAPKCWPYGKAAAGSNPVILGSPDKYENEVDHWPGVLPKTKYLVGTPPSSPCGIFSKTIKVKVRDRALVPPRKMPGQRLMMQWEPFFTPLNNNWKTDEAVPLIGYYQSGDRWLIRQHLIWIIESGIDIVCIDWSNHIPQIDDWAKIPPGSYEILDTTNKFMDELARLRDEGWCVPQVTMLGGISSVPETGPNAVRGMLEHIWKQYVSNPKYRRLWAELDGKPLVLLLDCAGDYQRNKTHLDPRFATRYVSVTLDCNTQATTGFWSWMDWRHPVATFVDGKPEVMTVSAGCFGPWGWLGTGGNAARGHRNGATLVEDFAYAMLNRPAILQIHQFNEFAGQFENQPPRPGYFVDIYSPEFSDDMEPVSLTAKGYRGEGGWGFFYLNLLRALTDLYAQPVPETTVIVFSSPTPAAPGLSLIPTVRGDKCTVSWVVLGKPPRAYRLELDCRPVTRLCGKKTAEIDLRGLRPGQHTLRLVGEGTRTYYRLSSGQEAARLERPEEVSVELSIMVGDPTR